MYVGCIERMGAYLFAVVDGQGLEEEADARHTSTLVHVDTDQPTSLSASKRGWGHILKDVAMQKG